MPVKHHDAWVQFLLERANRDAAPLLRLSRRTFLGGTIGAAVVAHSVLSLGRGPSTPRIERVGPGIRVSYRSHVWNIDPAAFGSAARARFTRDGTGWRMQTRRARLPGSDLAVDMAVRLLPRGGEWWIDLKLPALNFAAQGRLEAWLAGRALVGSHRAMDFAVARGKFAIPAGQLQVSLAPAMTFSFGACVVSGMLQCTAQGTVLALRAVGEDALHRRLDPGFRGAHATTFALHDARLRKRKFGFGLPGRECLFLPDAGGRVEGELVGLLGADARQAVLMVGPARVERSGAGGIPVRLREAAALLAHDTLHVAGQVAREQFTIALGPCSLAVAGDDAAPFAALFARGTPAGFDVTLRAEHLWAPIEDGNGASIAMAGALIQLRAGDIAHPDRKRGLSRRGDARANEPVVVYGGPAETVVRASLDGTTINLRRNADLVNLTFSLTGFDLRMDQFGATIVRRHGFGQPWKPAWVKVELPPQHLAETIYDVDNATKCNWNPTQPEFMARLSERPRLVFQLEGNVERKHIAWRRRRLTIESMTDWSELAPVVGPRSREYIGIDPEEQLVAGGHLEGDAGESKGKALAAIEKTFVPPTMSETALELSRKLIFSPSEKARWICPRPDRTARGVPLWNLRLDPAGRKTVRAVWSSLLSANKLPNSSIENDPLSALQGDSHWDIVGQTSVYGLPALRGIEPPGRGPGNTAPGARVSKGGVVLPDRKPAYIDGDNGLAIATPFQDADITLTSLGAIVRAEWIGEPPRVRLGDVMPYSLERLSIETWLGRDIRVVAQRKGFLLPLGIRCTYVTVAERRFFEVAPGALPVSREIRRSFLLTHGREKAYPALDQPNDARDFPASRVRMLTRSTPDLVSPELPWPVKGGLNRGGRVLPGGAIDNLLVFWPRIAVDVSATSDTRDVDFTWAIDDSVSPAISKLLFVENGAIDKPNVIEELLAYYDRVDLPLRTVRHAGARRRYAPSVARSQPGNDNTQSEFDTAFDTDAWVMRVRSREIEGVPNFTIDARMEGADQPPFYPAVDRAQVQVQSIDRLLGRAHGAVTVGFDPAYVREGFTGGNRAAEIFLDVLGPRIEFDVGAQGQSSGGVAKPGAVIAALSRRTGIVGGRDRLQPNSLKRGVAAFAQSLASAPTAPVEPPFDFDAARQGTFDPREFFGDRLSILGINLLDVLERGKIDAAPKLIESMDFGPGGDEALRRLRDAARAARTRLGDRRSAGLLRDIDAALERVEIGHSPRELYPEFATAYDRAADVLVDELGRLAEAAGPADVLAPSTKMVAAVKPLLPRLVEILSAPVPPVIKSEIEALVAQWQQVRIALGNAPDLIARIVRKVVSDELVGFCEAEAGVAMRLLRINEGQCTQVLQNPRKTLTHVGETLFRDVFGEDFARMLDELEDIKGALDEVAAMARAEALALVMQAVHAALRGAGRMALFAQVAKAQSKLQQWCATGDEALAIVGNFGWNLLGSVDVEAFATKAAELKPPSSGVAAKQFEQARAALLQAIARLKEHLGIISATGEVFKDIKRCDKGAILERLASVFGERQAAVTTLRDISQWIAKLETLDASARAVANYRGTISTLNSQQSVVTDLRTKTVTLLLSLTSIEKVFNRDTAWQQIVAAVKAVVSAAKEAGQAYVGDLDATVNAMETNATSLRTQLLQAATAHDVATIALQVEDFVRRCEKRLAALVLQPISIDKAAADAMARSARGAVLQCLVLILKPHEATLGALNRLNQMFGQYPVVGMLVGDVTLDGLRNAEIDLGNDVKALQDLNVADSDPEFLERLDTLLTRWQRPPRLLLAFERFAQVMDAFAKANFGQALGDVAREALRALELEARALLSELVPAKLTTKYQWNTKLGTFGPFRMKASTDNDLRLDSVISVDLLDQTRRVEVTGVLQAFVIELLPKFDMATLHFNKCTFTSFDGKAPDFDFTVEKVVIGKLLEFLKPLQQWMSPGKENGPYFQLLLPPGIRAGYRYDAGLIQVGTLQFDGVKLDAYAILPFGDGPARFGFDFASEDQPFTISNPPYGGGGYVSIIATAKQVDTLELSLVMGAVTSIKFGPLNARGRVVAGFSMIKYRDGGMTISALIEAVGEGSIACFSICVFIRIQLFHYANGSVVGSARYSFSFKIGRYFKVKYSFTATYTIKGGKKTDVRGEAPALYAAGPCGAGVRGGKAPALFAAGPEPLVDVPKKASAWKQYRRHLAMDLLGKEEECPTATS